MNQIYKLSLKEIIVLASLLGKEYVTGIANQVRNEEISISKEEISEIVDRLEKKKAIRYDLNGTLAIQQNLRFAVELFTNPKSVLVVASFDGVDNVLTKYHFFSDLFMVELVHNTEIDCFEICVAPHVTIEDCYSDLFVSCGISSFSQRASYIPLRSLLQSKEQIYKGHIEMARDYIGKFVEDMKDVDVLMESLCGHFKSIILKEYRRVGYRLSLVSSDILLNKGNKRMRIRCEDDHRVKFETFREE